MKGVSIKQGASLGLLYGLEGDPDLTGWKCKVAVKDALTDATPVLELTLTSLNAAKTRFVGLINRSTTEEWEVGDKFLVADVYNETSGEGTEIHAMVRVGQQGIPA